MSNIPVSKRWSTRTNFIGGLGGGITGALLSIFPELVAQTSPMGFFVTALVCVVNLIFQCTKQKEELPEKEISPVNQRGHHGQQKEKT